MVEEIGYYKVTFYYPRSQKLQKKISSPFSIVHKDENNTRIFDVIDEE